MNYLSKIKNYIISSGKNVILKGRDACCRFGRKLHPVLYIKSIAETPAVKSKFIYYHRFLGLFLRFRTKINRLDYDCFPIKIRKDILEIPFPGIYKLNPTYVFIRQLAFHPVVNIRKMQDFKSLLKWKFLDINYPVAIRNYPLGFIAGMGNIDRPKLALKVPPNILSINRSDLYLKKGLRINEEIVTVMPYVKKTERKKLVKVPIIKEPLHKYHFSREQMKIFREKIAQQNNTSWINIQIFEIFDKFYSNLYLNVRQSQGTKNLECTLSYLSANKNVKKNYYLVIGQRRDNGQSIKAIVDSADIKRAEHS